MSNSIPAIEGGDPIRKVPLPFSPPWLDEREIKAVVSVLKSGWITSGKVCQEFEDALTKYTGAKRAVLLNSATAGLFLLLKIKNVGPGDEVITTPYTFAATANVIVHVGATPVFADIDYHTFNISPDSIGKHITKKTRAVIPVHFGGNPADVDSIREVIGNRGVEIIEDAAHAVGASYRGRRIGNGDNPAVFSFHAVKNLTTAEGGAVMTDDEELYHLLKLYSLHGQTRDAYSKLKAGGWKYDIVLPGYKFNMTDIQAAIGIEQLKKLEENKNIRKRIASKYSEFLETYDFVELPECFDDNECSWHLYPVKINFDRLKINRDKFIQAMGMEGVATNVHYIPLYMMDYYRRNFDFDVDDYPNCNKAYGREVSLPIYPGMSDDDVFDVLRAFKKLVDYYYIH